MKPAKLFRDPRLQAQYEMAWWFGVIMWSGFVVLGATVIIGILLVLCRRAVTPN